MRVSYNQSYFLHSKWSCADRGVFLNEIHSMTHLKSKLIVNLIFSRSDQPVPGSSVTKDVTLCNLVAFLFKFGSDVVRCSLFIAAMGKDICNSRNF